MSADSYLVSASFARMAKGPQIMDPKAKALVYDAYVKEPDVCRESQLEAQLWLT